MKIAEVLTAGFMIFTPAMVEAPEDKSASIKCLAMNMYHEARGQGSAGLLGVSSVVMNRVKDKRFPNTICEVVHQGPTRESWKTRQTPDPNDAKFYPIRHRCQFSWYCDGRSDEPKDKKTYERAKLLRGWWRSSAIFNESEGIKKRFSTKVDGIPYDGKYIFLL